jgi:hypothetical protein
MMTHNHPRSWLRTGLLTVAMAGAFALVSFEGERTASAQAVDIEVAPPYPGVAYGWAPGYGAYAPAYGYYGTYGYSPYWRHYGWHGYAEHGGYRGWHRGYGGHGGHGGYGGSGGHHAWGRGHHR